MTVPGGAVVRVGFQPIIMSLPTHIEVESGCDNFQHYHDLYRGIVRFEKELWTDRILQKETFVPGPCSR